MKWIKDYNIFESMIDVYDEASKPISDLEMVLKTNAYKKATSFLGQSHTLIRNTNYINIFVSKDSLLKQIMDKDPQTSWYDKLSIALPKNGISSEDQEMSSGSKPFIVKTMNDLDFRVASEIQSFLEYKKKILITSTLTGFLMSPIISWFIGNKDVTLDDAISNWFFELKKIDPIDYASKVKALDEISLLKDLRKELIAQDPDLIAGANIIRRFGFGS